MFLAQFRLLSSRPVPPTVTQLVIGFISWNFQLDRAPRSSVITRSARARTWGVEICGDYCATKSACCRCRWRCGYIARHDAHPMPDLDAFDAERFAPSLWDRCLGFCHFMLSVHLSLYKVNEHNVHVTWRVQQVLTMLPSLSALTKGDRTGLSSSHPDGLWQCRYRCKWRCLGNVLLQVQVYT